MACSALLHHAQTTSRSVLPCVFLLAWLSCGSPQWGCDPKRPGFAEVCFQPFIHSGHCMTVPYLQRALPSASVLQ